MSYGSKSRGLLGFMMALILLSFFYVTPVQANARADILRKDMSVQTEAECHPLDEMTARAAALTLPDVGFPEETARITLIRELMDEILIMTREQQGARTLLLRFLALVVIVILMVYIICRQLCRRYGYHMIPHWQNINYIHKVDGKKGERFSVYIG